MAPEVIKQSGHGLPSDIWSFGATVIEMGMPLRPDLCRSSGLFVTVPSVAQFSSFCPHGSLGLFISTATGKPPWPEFTNSMAALFHVATSNTPPPMPPNVSTLCTDFLAR